MEKMLETKHKSPVQSQRNTQHKKKNSGFIDFIKDSFKFEKVSPKGSQRGNTRRTQTMREISGKSADRKAKPGDDHISTLSDNNLKTIIKDLNDPRARKKRFLIDTGSSSEEDNELKIFGGPRYNLEELKEKKKNEDAYLRPLEPSLDFDYESHIIRKKKIDDSQAKLKEDLLVTTLDYPRQPTFGPETPWGASEKYSMKLSGKVETGRVTERFGKWVSEKSEKGEEEEEKKEE